MTYDASFKIPADAKAVVITPTLVADRFVQLTPVYEEGPVMADKADIALKDRDVPVELYRHYAGLLDLSETMRPHGVKKEEPLDHLLDLENKTVCGKGETG